jgi:NAD-specific glutamate dehydrogenase
MHIRNGHIQQTQSLHTAKKVKRRRQHGKAIISFKIAPQTINEIENPRGCRLGTVSGKKYRHWGV